MFSKIRYHFGYGLMSGYPVCCILYFFSRMFFLDTFKLWDLIKVDNNHSIQHVMCPVHTILYKFKLYKLNYSQCKCGWFQLNEKHCLRPASLGNYNKCA